MAEQTTTTNVKYTPLAVTKVGRPSVITGDVVTNLVAYLQRGLSIETACNEAGVSRQSYYRRYETDETFRYKMDSARKYTTVIAAQNIMNAIIDEKKPNLELSKWWLERKEPEEFGGRGVVINNNNTNNNLTYLS